MVGWKGEHGIVFPLSRVMFETYLSAYFGSHVSQRRLILCPTIRGALVDGVDSHWLPRPLEGVVARTKPPILWLVHRMRTQERMHWT